MIVFNLAFPPIAPLNLAPNKPSITPHTPTQIYPYFDAI